jgi:hypothetical protein
VVLNSEGGEQRRRPRSDADGVDQDRQLAALGRKPRRELVRLPHEQVRPQVAGEGEQIRQDRRRELGEHGELPGAAGCLEARQERVRLDAHSAQRYAG